MSCIDYCYLFSGVKLLEANPDVKRLYDDLLSNYNRLIRPVTNVSDILTVRLGLKLSQLMEVNLKNQVMTTNLWVEQVRVCYFYFVYFYYELVVSTYKAFLAAIKIA